MAVEAEGVDVDPDGGHVSKRSAWQEDEKPAHGETLSSRQVPNMVPDPVAESSLRGRRGIRAGLASAAAPHHRPATAPEHTLFLDRVASAVVTMGPEQSPQDVRATRQGRAFR